MKAFPAFTPASIDVTPAATLDWLLAIDAAVDEARKEASDG